MAGEYGIVETSEILDAANEAAIVVLKNIKGGVAGEFAAFLEAFTKNEEFLAVMQKAYDKVTEVPKELGDLQMVEAFQLGARQLTYVPRLLEALRNKAPLKVVVDVPAAQLEAPQG